MQGRPITSILIANRGEIALRVMASARAMGIRTIAIYAEDDAHLPFVREADEAHSLGDGALKETYLNIEKIVTIAKAAKADAIHPGYGFLSENAAFAEAVVKAGIVFIGPSPEVISLMGDKVRAREAAKKIGVPLVPGYDGPEQDAGKLEKEAQRIGFPLLIKAAAGGGGKGMRIVESIEGFGEACRSAQSEAQAAFGDGRVFLEKYLLRPRHIEVQVFSDSHGNHVHLFERECSIQRRHQKIVEETPSPGVKDKAKLLETAVTIARGISYRGAGTVEFIADESGAFYFLEMNTRLQVEHPVTEMVTGVDLVRWQIIEAGGGKVPLTQGEIRQNGHAIEVRLYAEDPDQGFLPTGGTIRRVGEPAGFGVRFENGYEDGCAVATRYDPMLAKLAAHGATREEAAERLVEALGKTFFSGVKTNRSYLQRILRSKAFLAGDTTTDFVGRHAAQVARREPSDEEMALALAAVLGGKDSWVPGSSHARSPGMTETPWVKLAGFRVA
ncbi:MAG: ATP-grasp domain-containing protein [Alphaproteobacteria bacterium]|nr:ATP-grasp domain-containing protein [Alphaproteobacteria bacterium]